MLTDRERQRIEAEARSYPNPRAAVPEALKIVQDHRGWVPDKAVREIAELLGLSPATVDSTATFYNLILREPAGRHVIFICDNVSCWVTGYHAIRDHLCERLGIGLGETTEDKRFTLLPAACLGECDRAPAMMVDGDVFGNLNPEMLDAILAKYD
jgi:NADH-quinone oxidoreductase subunit E